MTTTIEWTDATWNPVRGCSIVSEGCRNCYAMKQAHRFSGEGMPYEGLTELGPQGPRWTGTIRLVPELLDAPLRWKTPRRIFVNSMSDLFHEDVPDEFIVSVFTVMAIAEKHTFQVLTKRPRRMLDLLSKWTSEDLYTAWHDFTGEPPEVSAWPLPNVWLGVSVEDQKTADERIPILLQTPAAVRFVSAEPLLGPVDLQRSDELAMVQCVRNGSTIERGIDWVIVGGESGPGARPCDVAWIRSIVEQCQAAAVPCFVKQLGSHPFDDGTLPTERLLKSRKGGDPAEWPADLRVREMPR